MKRDEVKETASVSTVCSCGHCERIRVGQALPARSPSLEYEHEGLPSIKEKRHDRQGTYRFRIGRAAKIKSIDSSKEMTRK